MVTYGLIYTYNGDNSYSVRFPLDKPVYWEVAKNVPELPRRGKFWNGYNISSVPTL